MDVPVKWLSFFMHDDDRLAHIRREYGAGRMLTGEVKAELTKVLHRHSISRTFRPFGERGNLEISYAG